METGQMVNLKGLNVALAVYCHGHVEVKWRAAYLDKTTSDEKARTKTALNKTLPFL